MTSARLAVLAAALAGSTAAWGAETVFPPGSRIGLTPPAGMEVSKRFTGFEHPKGAAITLFELPVEAAADMGKSFSQEALKKQGFVETAREKVKVAGKEATLISGEQAAGSARIRKWILVAPESDMTAFAMGQLVQGADTGVKDADIRQAMASIALKGPLPIQDRMAALPFKLTDQADFRAVRVLGGNSLLLTDGPKDQIEGAEQPLLVVAQSMNPGPPADQRDAFARATLGGNANLKELFFERSQGFRQRGGEWHEIVARAKDAASGQPVVVMQTIRWSGQSYLRMVGVARADAREKVLPRFRRVVDGIEAE